jgi:hypothetical protein
LGKSYEKKKGPAPPERHSAAAGLLFLKKTEKNWKKVKNILCSNRQKTARVHHHAGAPVLHYFPNCTYD